MNDNGWDVVPLRAVAADGGLFVDGDWVESKDQDPNGEIRLTQLADVGDSFFLDKSDRWINSNKFRELRCTEVLPGDILIARMPDPIARSTILPEGLGYSVITVVDVAILRTGTGWNSRYVMWAINSSSFRNDVDSRVSGSTRQRISRSALGRTKLFRPPLETQQHIADYLDRETAEIDAAVADLDKYVELLEKRKKNLVVKHIFPYGFPQNLLSASDYLALGYRSVQRIGSFSELRKKRNENPTADYLSLLRGRGVIPYEEKGNVGNKRPQDLTTSFMVEKGDYLVNSMNFGIGSFGRSSYSGVASAAYLIFFINEELVNPDFLQFVFENDDLRAQAQNLGNGILEHRKSINWDRFRAIYIPVPQREEQDAIVDVLSRETSELQSLIVESTKLRDLLLQRRSVLITEVVTGRKQV